MLSFCDVWVNSRLQYYGVKLKKKNRTTVLRMRVTVPSEKAREILREKPT